MNFIKRSDRGLTLRPRYIFSKCYVIEIHSEDVSCTRRTKQQTCWLKFKYCFVQLCTAFSFIVLWKAYIYCNKYFQKMKPLRWLLSYVVTNHLVNQAKSRITQRLSSSYTAFSNSKINEIHFIRGMARITSYCLFRGKKVRSFIICLLCLSYPYITF